MSHTLINFVHQMNVHLAELGYDDGSLEFIYGSNGYMEFVTFNSIRLWDSESDERDWDEDLDQYVETVQEYCIRKFQEFSDKLEKVSLTLGDVDV